VAAQSDAEEAQRAAEEARRAAEEARRAAEEAHRARESALEEEVATLCRDKEALASEKERLVALLARAEACWVVCFLSFILFCQLHSKCAPQVLWGGARAPGGTVRRAAVASAEKRAAPALTVAHSTNFPNDYG